MLAARPFLPRSFWRRDRCAAARHCGVGRFGRLVDHDAFECAGAPLVELEAARQRFHTHLEVLHLDAHPRGLEDEVVHDFKVQLVESAARRFLLGVERIQLRLHVERLDERTRVEHQLQQRLQQPAQEPHRTPVGLEERVLLEPVVGRRRRRLGHLRALELIEEIGPHAPRIEELLELDRREVADLVLGVVHAALLANTRANLFHDLLDVHRVGAYVEIRHR